MALGGLVLTVSALGCGSDVGGLGPAVGDQVIVASFDSPDFVVVSTNPARVVARPGPYPVNKVSFVPSHDGRMFYFAAADSATPARILGVDIASFATIWRDTTISHVDQGFDIYGVQGLAASVDGRLLYVASAYRASDVGFTMPGIVAIDTATHARTAFAAPFFVEPNTLVAIPPSSGFPAGALLVSAQRQQNAHQDWLFVLDPITLAVQDSAAIAPPNNNGASLIQIVPAPDGKSVYVEGATALYKYDLVTRTTIATAPLPSYGDLVPASDGSAVYLSDAGYGFDFLGSGFLFVFGPNLERRAPIDLRTQGAVNGHPPQTRAMVLSQDNKRLYVTAGTAEYGPVYPSEPGRLFVIDVASKTVLATVLINEWSLGGILLR
jgi:hypothetical protein